MFQRSGTVCSRCVRWTEKVSIQFLVMGSQKEGQGHGKGSVTLSDTGHKWFVYSVTRALFLIFVAHNPLTRNLNFCRIAVLNTQKFSAGAIIYIIKTIIFAKVRLYVRKPSLTSTSVFSLFVDTKNSEVQNLSATQQLETKNS